MASRSLNKVQIIGNLTRDPELRYTPNGAAVCTMGVATNRYWVTDAGEKKEETEFHRVVAWNKLAELCSQLLVKGRKVYFEGRLRTASWQLPDGTQKSMTEIVADDMIVLDFKRPIVVGEEAGEPAAVTAPPPPAPTDQPAPASDQGKGKKKSGKSDDPKTPAEEAPSSVTPAEDVNPDDIPF